MIAEYLKHGVLAGTVAGLAYGLYLAAVANPLGEYLHHAGSDRHHDHSHGGHHEHSNGHDHAHAHEHSHLVSETTTAIVSVGSGVLWAIFLGGVFAVALYIFEPALPGDSSVSTFVLAGAGFLTVSGTPWLVVPPAAPGAEYLYGVETRLAIYIALVGLGAAISAAAIVTYGRFAGHHSLIRLAAATVPVLAATVALPLATPTIVSHPDLSGNLVSAYQALAALSQAAIWVLLAATVSWLQRRGRGTPDAASPGEYSATNA